jgi:hypothetical protein
MNQSLNNRLKKLEEATNKHRDPHDGVEIISPSELTVEERAKALDVGRRYAALSGKAGPLIDPKLLSDEDLAVLEAIGTSIKARRATA